MHLLKLSIVAVFFLFLSSGCELINNPCSFDKFVIPVEIYPMKDTFYVGDTLYVHIEFSDTYMENGESYSITSEKIDFKNVVGFIQDTNFVVETALKNSEVITDTSQFNVFKYQFQVSGDYSILGDIEKMNDKFILDYAFTLEDTGLVNMFFIYSQRSITEPKVDFEECYPSGEIFKLKLPTGKDDNYDIYTQDDNPLHKKPGHKYVPDYEQHAAFTFYVVE